MTDPGNFADQPNSRGRKTRYYSPAQEEHARRVIQEHVQKHYRTLKQFADECGIAKSFFTGIFDGSRGLSKEKAEQLAAAMGLKGVEDLVGPVTDRNPEQPRPATPRPAKSGQIKMSPRVIIEPHTITIDPEEEPLVWLARRWGVARSIALITEAMDLEGREATIIDQPTVKEIREARKNKQGRKPG